MANSRASKKGIGVVFICPSNMDGVGTFEMADKLAEQGIMTVN